MLRWVDFLTISAERFVGPSTWDTYQDGFGACAMVMAVFRALRANLYLGALISFMLSDFLAVVVSIGRSRRSNAFV